MIWNGIMKDDKTIELKVSICLLRYGQRVSILCILPYNEEQPRFIKGTIHQPLRLSSDEVEALERICRCKAWLVHLANTSAR